MAKKSRVSKFINQLREISQKLPDKRAGRHNQQYEMGDALLGAFAVFFMQSASFLAYQRDVQRQKGRSNAESIFRMEQIPSDNHIRDLLDPVLASGLADGYEWLWSQLEREGKLVPYESLGGRLLVGIDGIQFFSSTKIHCGHCRRSQRDETIR